MATHHKTNLALVADNAGGRELTNLPWASHFKLGEPGVYKCEEKDDGQPHTTWICSPLWVEARTRDADGQNWGLLLSVQDPSGARHSLAVPMQMLAGNGQA